MKKSIALALLPLLVVGVAGAFVISRLHHTHANSSYDRGMKAVERGAFAEAKQWAQVLGQEGRTAAKHLLLGQVFLRQGKKALEHTPAPAPYEGAQLAGQTVLAPTVVACGADWLSELSATLFVKPFVYRPGGVEELRRAVQEFALVGDDDSLVDQATVRGAETLILLGNRPLAAEALQTLLTRHPDHLEARRMLGTLYLQLQCWDRARLHLEEWAKLEPSAALPHRWLGVFDKELGDNAKAIDQYQHALQTEEHPAARAQIAQELAAVYVKDGRYQDAIDTLDKVDASLRTSLPIQLERAECLHGLGKNGESLQILDAMLREHPTSVHAKIMRGKAYLEQDRFAPAIRLLEQARAQRPFDRAVAHELEQAYRAAHDPRAEALAATIKSLPNVAAAADPLKRKAFHDPWDARSRYELALLYAPVDLREARAWIQAALDSDSHNLSIRRFWTRLMGHQPPTMQ